MGLRIRDLRAEIRSREHISLLSSLPADDIIRQRRGRIVHYCLNGGLE
jgi:hypothetical protein